LDVVGPGERGTSIRTLGPWNRGFELPDAADRSSLARSAHSASIVKSRPYAHGRATWRAVRVSHLNGYRNLYTRADEDDSRH